MASTVPTTYAEFQALVETLKEVGIIPVAFGNRDRWPATNTFSLILGLTAGRAAEEEVLFGDEPWTNPAFMQAAADTSRTGPRTTISRTASTASAMMRPTRCSWRAGRR